MKKNKLQYLLILISVIGYILIGYFTKREQFYQFFGLYTIIFAAFILFYRFQKEKISFSQTLNLSIILRLLLLFAIPNLSNDFYRFIWDGRLINLGFNPYLSLPVDLYQFGKCCIYGERCK